MYHKDNNQAYKKYMNYFDLRYIIYMVIHMVYKNSYHYRMWADIEGYNCYFRSMDIMMLDYIEYSLLEIMNNTDILLHMVHIDYHSE
jgi:hypothetical protein